MTNVKLFYMVKEKNTSIIVNKVVRLGLAVIVSCNLVGAELDYRQIENSALRSLEASSSEIQKTCCFQKDLNLLAFAIDNF